MSITTTTRQASIDEIAAEMDRRGMLIEQLEARLAHIDGIDAGAIDNLHHHQRQLDADGIEVGVSRQALLEVLTGVEAALPALRAAPAGDVAEALNPDALAALKNGQRQLDQDGVEVGVSRQALDELIAAFEARTALSAQGWRTPGEFQELHIIFQDDGGPANLRFVEVETPDGKSVRAGTWLKRDGYDVLALTVHKSDLPAAPSEGHAALEQEGR